MFSFIQIIVQTNIDILFLSVYTKNRIYIRTGESAYAYDTEKMDEKIKYH